ncbi:MAG: dicarboxylate/amino acid:cation symporter [Deltaproteobacteria bacterium]|nr:dicarboxylate/amino acid:cation symporter [Deltaproteobacteria bacterium]
MTTARTPSPSPSPSREASLILIGLVLGGLAGVTLNALYSPVQGGTPSAAYERTLWIADNLANPAGQIFLRMLFMVVVPLVFCSIFLGVSGLGNLEKLGRIGTRTLLWFVLTTAFAATIGLTLVNVARPGARMDPEVSARVREEFKGAALETMEQAKGGTGFSVATFVNIIPRNFLRSASSERETLGVIFFALVFGIASTMLEKKITQPLIDVLQAVYDLCVRVLGFAMKLAPVGVAGLIFSVTAKLGFDVLASLLQFVVVAIAGLLIHQFLVLGVLVRVFVGISPWSFFRRCRTLFITAFSTSSSSATLPTTIRTAVEEFGAPPDVARFVIPLGATMNMNGTALFEGVTVLFLAQVAGVELGLVSQLIVVVLAVLTAIGAAGVAGGSLPLLAVVLAQVGVPPDMLALVLGVDRIIDMTRTVPNVTSDLVATLFVARRGGYEIR